MLRKHNRRPVRRAAAAENVVRIQPGNLVVFQTNQRLSQLQHERLARVWQQHFGARYPAIVLEGEWRINVVQKTLGKTEV